MALPAMLDKNRAHPVFKKGCIHWLAIGEQQIRSENQREVHGGTFRSRISAQQTYKLNRSKSLKQSGDKS
jgi:hypothetical protein